MKAKHIKHLLLIPIVAAAVAGCSSAPSRFYTLNSTAAGDGAPAANYAVAVGPVSVPALVDRPQFTVQVATNRVAIDEFNRWAAPLNDNITRVVTEDLAALLGTPRVAAATLANFDPAYRVTIDVQRFESFRSGEDERRGARRGSMGGPQGDGWRRAFRSHGRARAGARCGLRSAGRRAQPRARQGERRHRRRHSKGGGSEAVAASKGTRLVVSE